MYKSKLQEMCHKEKWGLPKYTCIRDGSDHCPQFTASVVVGGAAFHTPSAANSSKQALNQAAQLAFLHFTSKHSDQNVVKEVESSKSSEDKSSKNLEHSDQNVGKEVESSNSSENLGFKNKLKMYARKRGLPQPEYHTEKEGDFFKATVSVGEDSFTSNDLCATADDAHNSAAATALLDLLTDAFHENLHKSIPEKGFFPPTVERAAVEPRCEVTNLERRFGLCGISDPPSSPISDGAIGKSDGIESYLLSNRVRVFTRMPNMALPKGTVVLPVREDRWAVVALEFPNERAV